MANDSKPVSSKADVPVIVRRVPEKFLNRRIGRAQNVNRFQSLRDDFMNRSDIHNTGSPPHKK